MKTVSAIFDSEKDAERALNSLLKLGLERGDISIIHQGADGSKQDKSWWESIKDFFVQDEDKYAYSEGLRRGGYLLTATVDDDEVGEATEALERCNPIDMEGRTAQWRAEGWNPQGMSQTGQGASTGQGMSQSSQSLAQDEQGTEETIPVIREELKVGKRAVSRGTIRVHARIVEVPVREDVRLREERVQVERRPASGRATAAGAGAEGLRDRTIEVSETSEEPVVSKEARVEEEVVVKKVIGERTEGVDDTVRHTEVEVDDDREPVNQPPPRTSRTDRPERRPR